MYQGRYLVVLVGGFFAGHLEHFIGWRYGYIVMAICTLIGAIWAYKSLHRSQNFIISENFRTAFATLFSHTKKSSCHL